MASSLSSIHRVGNSIFFPPHLNVRITTHNHSPSFPHPPFKPFCTYAVPNNANPRSTRPRRSQIGNINIRRNPQNRPPLPHKDNHRQINNNQIEEHPSVVPPPNVDLMSLCNEGKIEEALEFLSQGVSADYTTFEALLNSCGSPKSLELGKRVHELLVRSPYVGNVELNNKLIEMYVKCGSMRHARRVFDRMRERNLGTWHLMLEGYANNGEGDKGLLLFGQMRKAGLQPSADTFVTVLSACTSAGEGFIHFESMKKEYNIDPGIEHYLGFIHVLGNAGHVNEAMEFIEKMPIEPSSKIWEAIMNIAHIHGDIETEDRARELLVALEPSKTTSNEPPIPPPKKQSATNMLEGKDRVAQYRSTNPYKGDAYEKLKAGGSSASLLSREGLEMSS
ncbi:hypothetical protein U1Q18_028873 [Sarracenia purpurea var. burkii]